MNPTYTAIEKFVANQIIQSKVTYIKAISERTDLKEGIDNYLNEIGREDIIVA